MKKKWQLVSKYFPAKRVENLDTKYKNYKVQRIESIKDLSKGKMEDVELEDLDYKVKSIVKRI